MKTIIKNAKVLPMVGDVLECGDILMEDGKIIAVGQGLKAGGAREIDAAGLWALPGYVDAHCHIAMEEDGMGFEGNDINESVDPITPHLRAVDAMNPEDYALQEACEHGVTTACTGPGSANVIGGQFAAIKTHGRNIDDMLIKAPLALKVAFGENPKRVYSGQNKSPRTRMATAALLRQALTEAQNYRRKQEAGEQVDRDLKLEILGEVLAGNLPVKAHAHRSDDILTALRIAKEFNLDMTLEHCTEGYRIVDILKQENARVILGPLLTDRSKIELKHLTFRAPAVFAKAGMEFAIMTDHPVVPLKYLPVCASLAVKEGLDPMEALKAITIYPARITGIADRVGSLEAGKDADIVLHDGDPLDVRSHVVRVYVAGEEVFAR